MSHDNRSAANEEIRTASIVEYFAAVTDPRIERTRLHPLASILTLSLCAVICGADSFVAIEEFGKAKEDWLKTFLDLPNGIPSHDTIGRVFAYLDPKALEAAFRAWVAAIARLTKGEVVAIDGKTLRGCFHKAGNNAFVHMVSAWATANRLVLGQVKTDEKSNEITAIPALLKLLHIKGCLVTIDAMGCQKEIAKSIIEANAQYMLAVKDNQPSLLCDVIATFEAAAKDCKAAGAIDCYQTEDKGHGRTEVRRCWTTSDLSRVSQRSQWKELSGLVLVESERSVNGKTSIEQRYYITSQVDFSAKEALSASRSHWGVENELHWVLDVAFREDDCRVRAGFAAENFAVMRHIALNMLKSTEGPPKHKKLGVKNKRMLAGWDDCYFLKVLGVCS
jgi:predicted transposase YbfD/YdcC